MSHFFADTVKQILYINKQLTNELQYSLNEITHQVAIDILMFTEEDRMRNCSWALN